MSRSSRILSRLRMLLVLWLSVGAVVLGMAVLEVCYLKRRGFPLRRKSALESTTLVDVATAAPQRPVAKILCHRRYGATTPNHYALTIQRGTGGTRAISLPEEITPYRLAISPRNALAILTRSGQIYLGTGRGPHDDWRFEMIWDTQERTLFDLEFSADGTYLAAQGDGDLKLWDCDRGQPIGQGWPRRHARFLNFFPDARHALEATDRQVHVRDLASGQIESSFAVDARASAAAISGNGERALLGTQDSEVRMIRLADGEELWRATSASSRRLQLAASDRVAYFLASNGREVLCCDASSGRSVQVVVAHDVPVHALMLLETELSVWDMRGRRRQFAPLQENWENARPTPAPFVHVRWRSSIL